MFIRSDWPGVVGCLELDLTLSVGTVTLNHAAFPAFLVFGVEAWQSWLTAYDK